MPQATNPALTIILPDQRTMACADVDMDIHGDDDDQGRQGFRMSPQVQYYQATELIPDKEGPLHSLLQKQPAVLGVRAKNIT